MRASKQSSPSDILISTSHRQIISTWSFFILQNFIHSQVATPQASLLNAPCQICLRYYSSSSAFIRSLSGLLLLENLLLVCQSFPCFKYFPGRSAEFCSVHTWWFFAKFTVLWHLRRVQSFIRYLFLCSTVQFCSISFLQNGQVSFWAQCSQLGTFAISLFYSLFFSCSFCHLDIAMLFEPYEAL